jgi:hypothetical protein
MSPKQKAKGSDKDYEELGRMLETLYETGYAKHHDMYKMSFLKGVAAGFGGVLGATLLVGLLIWILSLFDTIPLIGPVVDNLHDAVQTQNK